MQSFGDLINRFRELFQNLPALIQWAGYVGLTAIVFTETGLLIGFFLPGDSLLVTAGVLAAGKYFNVYLLGCLVSVAAIVGDSVGYMIGKASGPRLFNKEDSLLFNKKHLVKAHDFYERNGSKTIVLARFIPIIRTFAPVVAGMAAMDYRKFVVYNIVGGLAWVWSMLFIGYFLGQQFPGMVKHIDIVAIVIIFLSVLPALISRFTSEK